MYPLVKAYCSLSDSLPPWGVVTAKFIGGIARHQKVGSGLEIIEFIRICNRLNYLRPRPIYSEHLPTVASTLVLARAWLNIEHLNRPTYIDNEIIITPAIEPHFPPR